MEHKKRISKEKWTAFIKAMNEKYPEAFGIYMKASEEARNIWKDVGMFIGEEEFYGRFSVRVTENHKVKHTPMETIYIIAFIEAMLDILEKEFRWFRKNKKKLEILLKEYETREKYK